MKAERGGTKGLKPLDQERAPGGEDKNILEKVSEKVERAVGKTIEKAKGLAEEVKHKAHDTFETVTEKTHMKKGGGGGGKTSRDRESEEEKTYREEYITKE